MKTLAEELRAITQAAHATGKTHAQVADAIAPGWRTDPFRRFWYTSNFRTHPDPPAKLSPEQLAADAQALDVYERVRETNPFEAARLIRDNAHTLLRAIEHRRSAGNTDPNSNNPPPEAA